nr:MAG TPA: hypothetical protein [Caudoviricetes sp.]
MNFEGGGVLCCWEVVVGHMGRVRRSTGLMS